MRFAYGAPPAFPSDRPMFNPNPEETTSRVRAVAFYENGTMQMKIYVDGKFIGESTAQGQQISIEVEL